MDMNGDPNLEILPNGVQLLRTKGLVVVGVILFKELYGLLDILLEPLIVGFFRMSQCILNRVLQWYMQRIALLAPINSIEGEC